jgi:hypothetical protein
MDATDLPVAVSLAVLTVALSGMSARGFVRFARDPRSRSHLMWGSGLALAAAATTVELLVYEGMSGTILLQSYVFLSAAIVGVLSLGALRVLASATVRAAYSSYILAMCGATGVLTFTTPLSGAMVSKGVISGNPPANLLIVSTLVTGPATVVLLGAVVVSLRRSWRWQTLATGVGACILAAGGALYIASFPAALYYSEFLGVVFIFFGLVSMPHAVPTSERIGRVLGKSA